MCHIYACQRVRKVSFVAWKAFVEQGSCARSCSVQEGEQPARPSSPAKPRWVLNIDRMRLRSGTPPCLILDSHDSTNSTPSSDTPLVSFSSTLTTLAPQSTPHSSSVSIGDGSGGFLSSKASRRRSTRSSMFSPRSSNYERLEGGMGPSRNNVRRFAWKKFAIGAAVLIGLVYFVGPRREDLDDYMPCELSLCFSICPFTPPAILSCTGD